jgi:hypothetical protein
MTCSAMDVRGLTIEELNIDEINQVSGGNWVAAAIFIAGACFGGPAGDFANGLLDGLAGR